MTAGVGWSHDIFAARFKFEDGHNESHSLFCFFLLWHEAAMPGNYTPERDKLFFCQLIYAFQINDISVGCPQTFHRKF